MESRPKAFHRVCGLFSELEAMTGQWFYVISANNNRDRKSNEVACGSDIIRESIRTARRPNVPTANGRRHCIRIHQMSLRASIIQSSCCSFVVDV